MAQVPQQQQQPPPQQQQQQPQQSANNTQVIKYLPQNNYLNSPSNDPLLYSQPTTSGSALKPEQY